MTQPPSITFSSSNLPNKGCCVLAVLQGGKLSTMGKVLDKKTGGQITKAMKLKKFNGKAKTVLVVTAPNNTNLAEVILVGMGVPSRTSPDDWLNIGGFIGGKIAATDSRPVSVVMDFKVPKSKTAEIPAALIAQGIALRSYSFDIYKTKTNSRKKAKLKIAVRCNTPGTVKKAFEDYLRIVEGVFIARDLVNEPANVLGPSQFARRAATLSKLGVKIEILKEKDMESLGMGALLAVGQGSARRSRMVVMQWNGADDKNESPIAFIGKGVVFDTGGISLKPGGGMEDMKGDMGGAACVTGLMHALAGRKAKVNAVGIIGLVENMPSANAYRPGDIITSMSGQTIEVLNTDAEGRMVLADALWYTKERFAPKFMVNLATLTGAIIVALGKHHAGLFSNNDELAVNLDEAGLQSGERLWRLPIGPKYDRMIDSKIADMKNIGGRYAGSITAAQFLQRFVGDVPWAHLDVAGTAMAAERTDINPSWGSGFGVRLLDTLVADCYENK